LRRIIAVANWKISTILKIFLLLPVGFITSITHFCSAEQEAPSPPLLCRSPRRCHCRVARAVAATSLPLTPSLPLPCRLRRRRHFFAAHPVAATAVSPAPSPPLLCRSPRRCHCRVARAVAAASCLNRRASSAPCRVTCSRTPSPFSHLNSNRTPPAGDWVNSIC
jgi:hypothetical protein